MCDNPGPSDPKKRKVISDCNSPVTNYPEIINLYTLARCTTTFESTIQFCQHFKLLPKSVNCNKCEVELFTLKERSGRLEFKCHKRSCHTTISARKIVGLKIQKYLFQNPWPQLIFFCKSTL